MPDEALRHVDLKKLAELREQLPAKTAKILSDPANRAYVEKYLAEYDRAVARREAEGQQQGLQKRAEQASDSR